MADKWQEAWSRLNSALEHAMEHMTTDEIMQAVDDVLTPREPDNIERKPKPKRPKPNRITEGIRWDDKAN